jgi:hypothetical protein
VSGPGAAAGGQTRRNRAWACGRRAL